MSLTDRVPPEIESKDELIVKLVNDPDKPVEDFLTNGVLPASAPAATTVELSKVETAMP